MTEAPPSAPPAQPAGPIKPSFSRTLLAIAVGAVGGYLGSLINLPLAWMIGAMLAVTIAAASRLPVAVYPKLRAVMIAVLGVFLGSAFTPQLLEQIGAWSITLAALLAFCIIGGGVSFLYFRKVAGYDRITAYFSGMPGGLAEMVLVGSALGGDARVISLTHASRVLTVVLSLPFAFQLLEGYSPGDRPPPGPPLMSLPLGDVLLLTGCAIFGFLLAKLARLPAAPLVGPMLLSAAIHLAGWTAAKPPFELIAAAQVVVGSALGARFFGITLAMVRKVVLHSLGGTAILLGATLGFGLLLNQVTGISLNALILAFSPGGLAEMSLIGLALGMDPAFVACHHIARIFIVVVFAPQAFRLFDRFTR